MSLIQKLQGKVSPSAHEGKAPEKVLDQFIAVRLRRMESTVSLTLRRSLHLSGGSQLALHVRQRARRTAIRALQGRQGQGAEVHYGPSFRPPFKPSCFVELTTTSPGFPLGGLDANAVDASLPSNAGASSACAVTPA